MAFIRVVMPGGHATILYKYWKTRVSMSSKPRVFKSYELWLYATVPGIEVSRHLQQVGMLLAAGGSISLRPGS